MSKNKDQQEQNTLVGSDKLPAEIEIAKGQKLALGDAVAEAHKQSGLTVEQWNGLEADDRHGRIVAVIEEAKAAYTDNASKSGGKKGGDGGNKNQKQKGLRVHTKQPRRCRAGLRFDRTPRFVPLSKLSGKDVKAIKDDPRLIVEETEA